MLYIRKDEKIGTRPRWQTPKLILVLDAAIIPIAPNPQDSFKELATLLTDNGIDPMSLQVDRDND